MVLMRPRLEYGGVLALAVGVSWAAAGGVCGSGDRGRGRERWLIVCLSAGRSASGGWERVELLEGGEQFRGPWPVVLEAQMSAAAVERESRGDVQQSVAEPFGLGLGEFAVEQQHLGPDEQVVREHDDLQP